MFTSGVSSLRIPTETGSTDTSVNDSSKKPERIEPISIQKMKNRCSRTAAR